MKRVLCIAFLLACGSSDEPASSSSSTGDEQEGPCPTAFDECYDADSRAECLAVSETCPEENIVVLESCPVQYACDEPSVAPADGDDVASDDAATCAGLSATDSCMNEENFAACQAAEAQCPGSVAVMESCPLQFACQ